MTVASDLPAMQPGDIYEDKQGTKWVIAGFWKDPVVQMEQVWPPTEGEPQRVQGGIYGLMWEAGEGNFTWDESNDMGPTYWKPVGH